MYRTFLVELTFYLSLIDRSLKLSPMDLRIVAVDKVCTLVDQPRCAVVRYPRGTEFGCALPHSKGPSLMSQSSRKCN